MLLAESDGCARVSLENGVLILRGVKGVWLSVCLAGCQRSDVAVVPEDSRQEVCSNTLLFSEH